MTESSFQSGFFVDALWRDAWSRQRFTQAVELTMPKSLCLQAQQEITQWNDYQVTRLQALDDYASQAGIGSVYCKDEGTRFGLGSFKALGGAYAVDHIARSRSAGLTVSCATEGNHGRSVAWGAKRAGVRCVIFLHEGVSKAREASIAHYGAEIIRVPGSYDDAVRQCTLTSAQNNWQIVSDTSWPGYEDIPRRVMAGYSVIGQELLQQMDKPPTHVFLQAGVGGMAASLMASFSRCWSDTDIRYIIVEPRQAACLMASVRAAGTYKTTPGPFNTILAGLACGEPSLSVLELIYEGAHMMLALDDSSIKDAMHQFARPCGQDPKIVAGASGAAGLAGLQAVLQVPMLKKQLGLGPDSRVLLINTECDTDPKAYQDIIAACDQASSGPGHA